jgi:hypothetical protein
MGKSGVSGPFYGAKSLLISYSGDIAAATDASSHAVLLGINVPAYEEWLVTELNVWRASTHSTLSLYRLVDDSTVVADVAITSSLAGRAGSTTIARTGGEYEGYLIEAGSSVTLTATAGSTGVASTGIRINVMGFIRFKSSTRAE